MKAYRLGITVLSFALIVLGLAMIVVTVVHGGGIGYLIGSLFAAAGLGRLYILRQR
jgi:hypothetical protein